jgi:hypothetical protein
MSEQDDNKQMLQQYLMSLNPQLVPQQTQDANPIPYRNGYDPSASTSPMAQIPKSSAPKVPAVSDDDKESEIVNQLADADKPAAPDYKAYLMKKFGFGGDDVSDESMKDAQEQAQQSRYMANLGQAGNTIGAALGGVKADNSFYDNMRAQSNQGVADINAKRAAQVQGLQQESAVQGEADKMSMDDPNSAQSKAFQATIQKLYPSKYTAEEIAAIPASMADSIYKPMELDAKLQEMHANNQMKNEMMSQSQADRRDKAQQTAYSTMRENALKFRGNKAVQNANEALRNSDSAMEIINSVKDYNNLNQTQYNLLTAEVAKIATGGAATEGSIHDARANTLQSKAASFWQTVSGKPTAAQLGEFVQQNKDYLEHLNDVNHKYIDEFQMNNAKAYKGRVSDDQYQEYVNDFGPKARAAQQGQQASAANKPSWAK